MKKQPLIPVGKIIPKRKYYEIFIESKSKKKKVSTTVVRLKRKNGEIIQDCDVYIGRACYMGGRELEQSKWHNPFSINQYGSAEIACMKYKEYILENKYLMGCLGELVGKRLGCWCKNKSTDRCHGDVLVELVEKMVHDKQNVI